MAFLPPETPTNASPTTSPTSPFSLSVVVLTWNEERNIHACLDALGRQTRKDFEVIVVDAASTDATARIVEARSRNFPVSLRLDVATSRIPIGQARNRGAALARADTVAFLSADAEADARWVEEAVRSIQPCDVLYGRQIHSPTTTNVAASVRGLHYHFPDTTTAQPERYASNVNAVIRKRVLEAFPFGETQGESALDDILLTRRSAKAGYRISYDPNLIVRHRDVDSARAEFTKNLREGRGWGELAPELGLHTQILAWGSLVLGTTLLLALLPNWVTLTLAVAVLYAPALRRVWRRRSAMPPSQLVRGGLASPAFDLAFLLAYVQGIFTRKHGPAKTRQIQETHA